MVLAKVSILLILSIFGMIIRARCDPVKSTPRAGIQLTTMKMDENKAILLKKTEPPKESPEWLKKGQARLTGVNLLSAPETMKGSLWMESSDKVVYSREFSEKGWRRKFSHSLHATATKPPISDSWQSTWEAYRDENGLSEQAKTFTKLRLLQSREETFKEIFMGVYFSLDLTKGHLFLEMNVTPSTEKKAGFSIRF